MRSALGIRRIRDVDVSQVLHATDADIRVLQSRLKSWSVPSFRSYPVLLRALTHPSISNWAERVLSLPRRSLGPNTLELLGDRIVGASVAFRVLQWRRAKELDVSWNRSRPATLVQSLVGNRGMALVASEIGIDQLIRWEKGRPPQSHRERLTSAGIDQATGLSSNVEINALSSAYEAVAAAIYLDGGFPAAESFVHHTLLQNPLFVQRANVDVKKYEEMLAREMEGVMGMSVSFVTSRHRPGRSASVPIKSFERVQCEILDLECIDPQNEAHRLHYAGVAVRPMSGVDKDICEEDVLFMASHFSVENARIAALTGALETLRGQKDARIISKESPTAMERLRMREIVFGLGSPELKARFHDGGVWWLDGEYTHAARVLHRAGAPGMGGLQHIHTAEIRETFRRMCRQRSGSEGEEDGGREERRQIVYARNDGREEGVPREGAVGEAAVCENVVAMCLEAGTEIEGSRRLTQEHTGLQQRIGTAEEICKEITCTVEDARERGMEERSLLMKGYHALGHNAMRVWNVQRSMSDVGQLRSEVIRECEERRSVGPRVKDEMIGDGLREVGDLHVKKEFVGLGICVERVGLGTALAWLSGAEERMRSGN